MKSDFLQDTKHKLTEIKNNLKDKNKNKNKNKENKNAGKNDASKGDTNQPTLF